MIRKIEVYENTELSKNDLPECAFKTDSKSEDHDKTKLDTTDIHEHATEDHQKVKDPEINQSKCQSDHYLEEQCISVVSSLVLSWSSDFESVLNAHSGKSFFDNSVFS
jgi:hypothetical protein